MIIDIHNHYWYEKDFIKKLIKCMDEANIDKVCLNGMGIKGLEITKSPEIYNANEDVKKAFKEYPDRIIGFGWIRLGIDKYDIIDKLYEEEFKGIKISIPTNRYDYDNFMPYYERAEKYDMPILFHTGVIAATMNDRELGTHSAYMRPVYLDRIARKFPRLKIIAAHMGDPWYLEAYMTSQKNPNMWLDFSGLAIFTKAYYIRKFLWIRVTPDKLLWGLDEPPEKYLRLLLTWRTLIEEIGIKKEEDIKGIFGENARKILNIRE